jgi:hypothetical protein
MVTLSVSTATITSSSLILSPGAFDQFKITAVVIESPKSPNGSVTTAIIKNKH